MRAAPVALVAMAPGTLAPAVAHGALVQVAAVPGACAHESVESPGPGWVGSRAKGLRQR